MFNFQNSQTNWRNEKQLNKNSKMKGENDVTTLTFEAIAKIFLFQWILWIRFPIGK